MIRLRQPKGRLNIFFFCFIVLIDSCVDRHEIPEHNIQPRLVVDGMITDSPGPYTIFLSKSAEIDRNLDRPVAVTKASVTILDDAGNEELLNEVSPGEYRTSETGIRGVIGRSYHVVIRIEDREYISKPQVLTPAGEIEDINFSFALNSINPSDLSKPQHALNVSINAKASADGSALLRWRWLSIYEVFYMPRLKTRIVCCPEVEVPNPPPCSGFREGNGPGGIVQFDVCTCCNCWTEERSLSALISDNKSVSDKEFRNVSIAKIRVEGKRFLVRYYMQVEQLSLSPEVYNFWKLIRSQQEGEGSLFQTNAVRVRGNIVSTTHPEEQVLGVFAVSAAVRRSFFIDRKDVPITLPLDTTRESCLLHRSPGLNKASNKRPTFW